MKLNCQKSSVIVRDKNPYFTYCNIVFSSTKKKKENALFTATGLCHKKKNLVMLKPARGRSKLQHDSKVSFSKSIVDSYPTHALGMTSA